MIAMWLCSHGAVQIPIHALMHVLDIDLESSNRSGNGLHLYCLIGFHAIDRAIAHFLICNRNLACGKGTRLNCCEVIASTGDYSMTIIMLGRLYSMLSCRLAPTDASSVQYR
jgi:hypothetical protein